jgi:hypothetical protein
MGMAMDGRAIAITVTAGHIAITTMVRAFMVAGDGSRLMWGYGSLIGETIKVARE